MHGATSQANSGCSLQFSLTTGAVAFTKSHNIANRCSNGDWLDTLDLSDDLEVHAFPYATKPNARLTLRFSRGTLVPSGALASVMRRRL
jgi:hypothetical protein